MSDRHPNDLGPVEDERERALAVLDTLDLTVPHRVYERFKDRIAALRAKIAAGADLHSPEIRDESVALQNDMNAATFGQA